jgi:hypothetical protein
MWTDIYVSSGIRTHDPSVSKLGHCYRHGLTEDSTILKINFWASITKGFILSNFSPGEKHAVPTQNFEANSEFSRRQRNNINIYYGGGRGEERAHFVRRFPGLPPPPSGESGMELPHTSQLTEVQRDRKKEKLGR